jgi:hypothetical protein
MTYQTNRLFNDVVQHRPIPDAVKSRLVQSSGELAAPYPISLAAASKHVKVLELVRHGRTRTGPAFEPSYYDTLRGGWEEWISRLEKIF